MFNKGDFGLSLMSVSEYAVKYKKDPGNIRRLLASGRIQGHKIGNQWVLRDDVEYPSDLRVVSGAFRNTRKKRYFNSNAILSDSVRRMIKELRGIYGECLLRAVLYGSYARGDEMEESDVDIALFINGNQSREMYEKMISCVARHEIECGKVLSVIDIDNRKYDEWVGVLPFYRNIEKEGIVLWIRK